MQWKKRNVMVTGAGGFIASHLSEKLIGMGANVTAFIRYNSRNDFGFIEEFPLAVREKMKIVSGDLRDPEAVYDAMRGNEILFHLGALIAIPYSYVHPREVIETNVLGTYNIMNAARRLNVIKVVHTSSSEVYGTAITVPIAEDHPLQGQSPYSASKIGADKIAESFYRSYNLPVATIRPFNTYGPRQSARAVIPTIIIQALKTNRIQLGSLQPTRDLTYVKDTVAGFIAVAESAKSVGETINIGSGFEISIGDLAQKITSLMGTKIKVAIDRKRMRPKQSEVERLWADNRKAKKMLGWNPRYTLEKGLEETIEWIKNNLNSYKSNIYNI